MNYKLWSSTINLGEEISIKYSVRYEEEGVEDINYKSGNPGYREGLPAIFKINGVSK